MSSDITPEQLRHAQFRTAIRGVDRLEVETFLDNVASQIEDLEAEHARLAVQLGDTAAVDLESEFDAVGREVSEILQAARQASDSMRERASADSAKWRSDAMVEADRDRHDAAADAEALRRDAWSTGSELLDQAVAESNKFREQAERDVLTTMGEAEREAHRLTSGVRRDAEDALRNATMNAEKMASEAAKRRDAIIDNANRQAATAQERARALEQRRDELLDELEKVRSTLTKLEGSLQEKRDSLDLTQLPNTTVRVVPTQPTDVENWVPGETVRIIRTEDDIEELVSSPSSEPVSSPSNEAVSSPSNEASLGEVSGDDKGGPTEDASSSSEPVPSLSSDAVSSPSNEARLGEVSRRDGGASLGEVSRDDGEGRGEGDDVGALFASLRVGGDETEPTISDDPPAEYPESATVSGTVDWIDERDTRLLPIANRALRGAKKSITELQNIALDNLRTDESWRPETAAIKEALQADLIGLWAESFAAGHSVAELMTGSKIKRPKTPASDATSEFSADLGSAVAAALDKSGKGQRERQSAASKMFRVWRTDEAERRIRQLAIRSFELGIETSVHVDA